MNKIKISFLELTQFCNMKCVFCDNQNIQKKKLLKFDEIKDFESMIDSVEGDTEHSYIDISGYGEVMTHPEFTKFLKLFKEKNKNVRINTNGTLIGDYLQKIIDSTVIELTISVNTLNRDTYIKLMGEDKLITVLDNINEIKNKGYKGKISLSFVINKYNFDEIPEFIRLGKNLNCHIACVGLTPTLKDMYPKDLMLEITEDVKKKVEEYKKYAEEQKISFFIFNPDTDSSNTERMLNIKNCHYVNDYFFVGVNGNVVPCCWSRVSMGNIKKEGFREIFDGKRYDKLRKLIKNGDSKYCLNCRKDG
jgi:MoaA/NifB/PqqE/SkfB family radical SAM enzyme